MTVSELTSQIMALPATERSAIAKELWESIEDEQALVTPESEARAVKLARQRDREMTQDAVAVRSHEQVMQDARRSIKSK